MGAYHTTRRELGGEGRWSDRQTGDGALSPGSLSYGPA